MTNHGADQYKEGASGKGAPSRCVETEVRYSAGFGAELLLISALVLVASGPALAQTAAGSFYSVSGQVQIQRAGGATIGAAAGVGVNVGDRIVTGANGHAVIMLNDQSRLELGPASSITLDEFTITGGATSTRVSLFSGVLRSLVNAASGGAPANYQVHTPNAVAAVRGTKFDTAYTENVIRPGYQGCEQYTDVSVYQGTVNLAPDRDSQRGSGCRRGLRGDAALRQASDGSRTAGDDRCSVARQRERRRRPVHGSGAVIGRRTGAGMSGLHEHDDRRYVGAIEEEVRRGEESNFRR